MYTVAITGIDGVFRAVLSHDGVQVDTEEGFSSIKSADRWAETRARLHKEYSRAAELVNHSRTFSV